jgi:hypothetical protein
MIGGSLAVIRLQVLPLGGRQKVNAGDYNSYNDPTVYIRLIYFISKFNLRQSSLIFPAKFYFNTVDIFSYNLRLPQKLAA